MGDLERDIAELETLLRRLEKEYEQFLAGQLRREPSDTEGQIQALIRAWSRGAIQNSTLAFRYASVVARYNAFRTIWTRRVREREEGRVLAGPARAAAPARRARKVEPAVAPPPAPAAAASVAVVDPARESGRLQGLYETYRRLREECGESVERLRPEGFQKALAERVAKIKEQFGCEAVQVRVLAEGGRTRIVAKPCRLPPGGEGAR